MRFFIRLLSVSTLLFVKTVSGNTVGPIALGMGCTGVALNEVWSVTQNPAGLRVSNNIEFIARQMNRYRIGNWNDASLGFSCNGTEKTRLGFILTQEGFSGYQNTSISAAIGMLNGKKWNSGISATWENSRIRSAEIRSVNQLRSSIGTQLDLERGHRIGLVLDDAQSFFKTGNDLRNPPTIRTGCQLKASETFNATLEICINPWITGFNGGLCYCPKETVNIRAGYSTVTKKICAGIGILWKKWTIESAVQLHPFLGATTSIGIIYRHERNPN
ncbi:MAG: hypothetical protein ACKOQ6_00025 [Bacteroidota bacterium]